MFSRQNFTKTSKEIGRESHWLPRSPHFPIAIYNGIEVQSRILTAEFQQNWCVVTVPNKTGQGFFFHSPFSVLHFYFREILIALPCNTRQTWIGIWSWELFVYERTSLFVPFQLLSEASWHVEIGGKKKKKEKWKKRDKKYLMRWSIAKGCSCCLFSFFFLITRTATYLVICISLHIFIMLTDTVFLGIHNKMCQNVSQILVFSLHADWLPSTCTVFRINLIPVKTSSRNKFLSWHGNTMQSSWNN